MLKRTVFIMAAFAILMSPLCPAARAQSCDDAANQWITENLKELPTSYKEISKIPLVYRRAAFRQLDATTRSNMWIAQLQGYLAANPHMLAQQRALITEALRIIKPELFSQDGLSRSLDRKLLNLRQRTIKAFGEDDARKIFGELGPVDVDLVAFMPSAGLEKLNQEAATKCSCADASSYCGTGYQCDVGACKTASGCGLFWSYDCDGLCHTRPSSIE